LCSISDFAKQQQQPCHCCISAQLACLESSECWLAGWLASVFMKKQLALSFALGLAFNRFQCQFIRQLPIDHHACLLPVLVFLDKKFLVLFHLLLFNYFQLILCLDSL
jgi:hypothetical protein